MSDPLTIAALIAESWQTADDKGWHELKARTFVEELALFHSELSEALNEVRDGHDVREVYYAPEDLSLVKKPEGVPIELADVIIRIADTCKSRGIDLEAALRLKLAFNHTRPVRHGGKRL